MHDCAQGVLLDNDRRIIGSENNVNCKIEGHIFGVKKRFLGDVHLCNKRYNSFGHYLQKAGKYGSNDFIRSNIN